MSELIDLAPGDRLVGDSFGRSGIYVVERVTKTMAICDRGAKFFLENGYLVGERSQRGWGRTHVHKFNERDALNERIAEAKRKIDRVIIKAENIDAAEAFLLAAAEIGKAMPGGGKE